MLILAYTFNNTSEEPLEVMNAKKDWIQEDKNFIEGFKNDFEITNDLEDFVPSETIETWINQKKLGISMKKFGMEMKRYTLIHKLENVMSNNNKVYGKVVKVWFGIKEIVEEIPEMLP
jgi:hypothetical protein